MFAHTGCNVLGEPNVVASAATLTIEMKQVDTAHPSALQLKEGFAFGQIPHLP
jgi:hypothetical protein